MASRHKHTSSAAIERIFANPADENEPVGLLYEFLDAAIAVANADKGKLQLLDEQGGSLRIVASRGLGEPYLQFFANVTPDSNSACAAALKQRLRVIVDNASTSYLFVSTPALDVVHEAGVSAMHSTPIISTCGRIWGVLTIFWRAPIAQHLYDPLPLEELSARLADNLQHSDSGKRILAGAIAQR
jgi:hypothetical protein